MSNAIEVFVPRRKTRPVIAGSCAGAAANRVDAAAQAATMFAGEAGAGLGQQQTGVPAMASKTTELKLKRAYDAPEKGDGFRVLVDRLWPRGLSKAAAKVDFWAKALAPSDRLRKDAHADPGFPGEEKSWAHFRKAYRRELSAKDDAATARQEAVEIIRASLKKGPVTLLYALKAGERNNAAALQEWLKDVL